MKKFYHMIVEKMPPYHNPHADMRHTRTEYIDTKQGHAPAGWRCVGVCGYHEEPTKRNDKKSEESANNEN